MFQPELFADLPDLGAAFEDRAVARPIGRRGQRWRPPQRAAKRVAALNGIREDMASLVQIMRGVLVEFDTLARRTEHDSDRIEVLLRKVTELQRAAGLTELHAPPRSSRRRPLGE